MSSDPDASERAGTGTARSMLQTSRFLGSFGYEDPGDLRARIGYTDPPTHVSTFAGIGIALLAAWATWDSRRWSP